jgi:hypothetical protein
MRTIVTGGLLAAAVGTALSLSAVAPASAQLARPLAAAQLAGDNNLVTDVQWRRGGWGWRGYGYRDYRYGPWVGAGVGLATGLAIGSALAGPRYYGPPVVYYDDPYIYDAPATVYRRPVGDAVAYCMQRFRSYDPASGTYLGYDGRRHPCP